MAFFEKLPKIRQLKTVRDPIASVPVFTRGDGDVPVKVQVLESSHRSAFFRLEKQVLLDNQTEGTRSKDVVIVVCHSAVSQGVLSLALVTGISQWRYPRILPEHLPQVSLDGRLGQNYEFSPDPPARRPARYLVPPRHREGRIEDRLADPRRVEVRRRVEDRPADPQRAEVPIPTGCLPRLDLTEEIFDRMEERLCLRRGG